APLFSALPKAVLGALIIEAVIFGMMDIAEMRRLARVQRFDFWIALLAIVATLLVGVLAGVMIGIAVSLLWLIAVTTHPNMPVLGRKAESQAYRDLSAHPDDEQAPGIVILRLDGGAFFAPPTPLAEGSRDPPRPPQRGPHPRA